MMLLDDGQLVRRDWSEMALDAGYILLVTTTVALAALTLHPHGIDRITVPILLAVAALNVGATIRQLIFTWRHVVVPVRSATWPADEEISEHQGRAR